MILERIRFMKVNKNKSFNYTPRYYDERKERIQKIKDSYSEDDDVDSTTAERQARMREKLQSSWQLGETYSKSSKAANIRLILIFAALLLGAYYILGYVDIFASEIIDLN